MKFSSPPPILTIAGSDSGGGAGIQADLKTIQALGGYGMSAITALTAQNTLGVHGVHSVPAEFVAQQIRVVLEDIGANAIKTGMLANAEIIEAVVEAIQAQIVKSPRLRGDLGGNASNSTYGHFGAPESTTRNRKAMKQAYHMRREMTTAEYKLWTALSGSKLEGYKFRRQQPIGEYIADFVNMKTRLIVEVDGSQHATTNKHHDDERTKYLHQHGYTVIRFWNNEVNEDLEGVVLRILESLNVITKTIDSPLNPPASGGTNMGHIASGGTNDTDVKRDIALVVDPVMIAKGGASLLEDAAVTALREKLLPIATLVTPNIPETEGLSGRSIHSLSDMEEAALAILSLGSDAVLIKGGHLDTGSEVHNLLLTQDGQREVFTSPRIDTRNTHGTGCTLSAAIATYLGRGETLVDACAKAEAYVAGAITHAPTIGAGHGPLNHAWNIRQRFPEA